jgi:hypothetical protein
VKRTGLTRTPLRRGAGLGAGKPPQRRVPLKGKNAPKRPRRSGVPALPPGEFTARVKLLVRKRAGRGDIYDARCECCGCHLGAEAGDFQHRAARGAGGCRDRVINGPANCALMCRPCHVRAEARDPHLAMDAGGFWVEHGTTPEFDPRNVAILLASEGGSGLKVYLAEDGIGHDGTGYLYARPEVTQ